MYLSGAYAPQPGLSAEEKDRFYEQLLVLVTSVAPSETCVAGDFNGLVGQHSQGFSQHCGGYGYGIRNQERMRILVLSAATDLDKYILQKEKLRTSYIKLRKVCNPS